MRGKETAEREVRQCCWFPREVDSPFWRPVFLFLWQDDENVSLQDLVLSMPSSPEPQEAESRFKTEDLLNEIKQLKDELKKKDETISRLEHQLVRATCLHADKFTQTSWKRSSPQVLQPSSSLPSSTDLAQGKLIKMPPTEAHSEDPKHHGLHENGNRKNRSAANASPSTSLNELNMPVSTQLSIKDGAAPHLGNGKSGNAAGPAELPGPGEGSCFQPAVKGRPPSSNQTPRPKTLGIAKPPTALVPPTVAVLARSANPSAASKEPELLPPSSPTRPEPASGLTNLKGKQSQKVSKLRPPTTSFVKSKQTSSQKPALVPPEPQNPCSKTSIPKAAVQRKENVQMPSSGLPCGDSASSARHSRLPKPKTH
uniref:Coiled-coil serine rich protein 2 n=1 Tax=Nothoprocta perdicaria TaxID=30464 RepID=A0A8C6YLD9_NOTPE